MWKFPSWTASIFIINIYFVVGMEKPKNPLKRPWLDLNLDPQDLPESPEESDDRNSDTSVHVPEDASSENRHSNQTLETNARILEHSSFSDYNPEKQRKIEMKFVKTDQNWIELTMDPGYPTGLTDDKWGLLCKEMLQNWKSKGDSLKFVSCSSSPYIVNSTQRWSRIKLLELNKKRNVASDYLRCHCTYHSIVIGNKFVERFAVKPNVDKDYFLLLKYLDKPYSYYWIGDILTCELMNVPT